MQDVVSKLGRARNQDDAAPTEDKRNYQARMEVHSPWTISPQGVVERIDIEAQDIDMGNRIDKSTYRFRCRVSIVRQATDTHAARQVR